MIRFTKARPKSKIPPKPKGNKKVILNKLKSFLTATEPKAIEFLVSFWNTQAQGLTYKELQEAYLAGEITEQRYQQWTQDYSLFIQNKLSPLWQQAANTAAAEVAAQYPKFIYEPSVSAAMDFIKNHGAELVTNITQEQRKALNAVIAHISGYTAVTPDEAARMIRPVVGLTMPQAVANIRHRQAVEQAYLKAHPNCRPETAKKKADEAAARYAGKQHRYRAQNIARTELAFAYNAGSYGATKDAQAQGYIGDCVKIWLTAYDERICHICERMDGEKRNIDEKFSNGKMIPPGHPSCRCAVAYEEIPETNLTPNSTDSIIEVQEPNRTGYQSEETGAKFPPNSLLPRYNEVTIPAEKFTQYALNPEKAPDKAKAFQLALGYNLSNYQELIMNIYNHLKDFPAKAKTDAGYGMRYEVIMNLEGPNGKRAKILTGWIDDIKTGEMRLTTVHVDD